MRSPGIIHVDPKSNNKCPYKRHTEKVDVETEAEITMM